MKDGYDTDSVIYTSLRSPTDTKGKRTSDGDDDPLYDRAVSSHGWPSCSPLSATVQDCHVPESRVVGLATWHTADLVLHVV